LKEFLVRCAKIPW